MGLDLLDTPVRITWDIPEGPAGCDDDSLPAVADAIVAGGVFFVTLQGRPLLHPAIDEALERFAGACQLITGCSGSEPELDRLGLLNTYPCQLLLDVEGFTDSASGVDTIRLQQTLKAIRDAGLDPALSLPPLRNNLSNITDLLRFCAEHKVAKFKLPNAHIGDSFQQYSPQDLPRWQDLEQFTRHWHTFLAEQPVLPALEIHDLFLWEIMTPGQEQVRSEYGGCQAANSLGHIDTEGVVHPCAAWPLPLGRLPEESLAEIWAGPQRQDVCIRIAATPKGCLGCDDLERCFGGCRGLAQHLNQHQGERDLMCSGPRKRS